MYILWLKELFLRAKQNEVPDIVLLESEAQIKEIEPHCRGLKAIHSPHTGKQQDCRVFQSTRLCNSELLDDFIVQL